MSTSGTSALFNGSSRYSTDFQQIINRAVAIASLPMMQMQSQRQELSSRASALAALDNAFAGLQSAVSGLENARQAYATSLSDASIASASVTAGAMPGAYSFEVVDIGSYSSAMSKDGLAVVTDPLAASISAAPAFTLTVNGVQTEIAPEANTLTALAEAINASGAGAEATIVNIGGSAAPDYRLSLRSTTLGEAAIQLSDGSQELVETLVTGSLASYRVNGQPAAAISSDSRTVVIAPGVSLTMLKAGAVDLTVSRNATAVSSALSSLAAAYNAAVDEIDKHRGENAGALEGQSILYTLSQSLRQLAGYETGEGAITSLAVLGLEFASDGKLTFNATAFSEATAGNPAALSTFLGSAGEGGFLQFATSLLNGLKDSSEGVLTLAAESLNEQIAGQDKRIQAEQDRIDELEQQLIKRMSAADATIAALEQQVRFLTGLFQSMMDSWNND